MKFLMHNWLWLAVALVCHYPLTTFSQSPITVHVSIPPQKYFVERIGRDRVTVDVLVTPGKSPATFSPSPDQIKKLISTDVYFRIGVPFENGILKRIESSIGAKVVETHHGIVLRQMEGHNDDVENRHHDSDHHDDEGHHHNMGNDPHIWMNPVLVKSQAHTIFKTLSHIDPGGKDQYKTNHDGFIKDLDALDHRIKTVLKDLKGKKLFVFHPSFGYFTDAYGLRQVAVETMGKAPKGKALSSIIKSAKNQSARVIFVQPQFDRNAAGKIASAINGTVVSIDPLAYDYLTNLEGIAQTIAGVLKDEDQYAQ